MCGAAWTLIPCTRWLFMSLFLKTGNQDCVYSGLHLNGCYNYSVKIQSLGPGGVHVWCQQWGIQPSSSSRPAWGAGWVPCQPPEQPRILKWWSLGTTAEFNRNTLVGRDLGRNLAPWALLKCNLTVKHGNKSNPQNTGRVYFVLNTHILIYSVLTFSRQAFYRCSLLIW